MQISLLGSKVSEQRYEPPPDQTLHRWYYADISCTGKKKGVREFIKTAILTGLSQIDLYSILSSTPDLLNTVLYL